jgi:hypothetical protein
LTDLSRRFVRATLSADLAHLPAGERAAVDLLIDASRLLDDVFDRQAYAQNPALRRCLEADTSLAGRERLAYFEIMRGPWDRQDHHAPFATDAARPPGAGFYPPDLTAAAFRAFVEAHPDRRVELESLFTLVERQGDELRAVPFSKAFSAWLEPAAHKLEAAAELTSNASLRAFLRSRAAAFRSDDYYQSDKDWMDLDGALEVTIGPYETYEDELLGLKASFQSFVTVTDPQASEDLAKYKGLLPEMERHLPVPDHVKTTRGAESPIRVVDLVFSSGDARKSVQAIAFNLPNDERVRAEKGAKKVLLRNVIETKFERIMRPIAERVLDPAQLPLLSARAFFNETLFHELSHSLGPAFTREGEREIEVRVALGGSYAAIEEAKADAMGAYNVLYMIERGELPRELHDELLVSYFAGLFRSARFGVAEAHGKAAALQANRFLRVGAATCDAATGRFSVDIAAMPGAIAALVRDICLLQHAGDRAGVEAMLADLGAVSPPLASALARLDDIPIDIRPVYPLAGERA